MPPIRLGRKKTVLNIVEPLVFPVRKYAIVKDNKLISKTDTIVKATVNRKDDPKEVSVNALT